MNINSANRLSFITILSGSLIRILPIAICIGLLYNPNAEANRPADRRDAGVGLISGGSAGLVATGVGAPVAAFGFGFQIGWGIGCILFDPADTTNALVPVNVDNFLGYHFPNASAIDPSFDPTLGSALDTYMDTLDEVVAYSRAVRASLDRYEGALILGDSVAAELRLQEANAFRTELTKRTEISREGFADVITAFDIFDSTILDTVVNLQDLLDIRDNAGNGVLPPGESIALNAWQVNPEEVDVLLAQLAAIPNSVASDFFSELDPINGNTTTVREAWTHSVAAVSASHASEPNSIVLIAMGMMALVSCRKRKIPTKFLHRAYDH